MKTKLAFTLFLILNIGIALPKGDKIEGIIRDGLTNKTISEALITLEKNGVVFDTKYTSSNGEFSFFRLNNGDYNLKIEANNFKTEDRDIIIEEINNITHAFSIYLETSKPVIAQVEVKEYPMKSDYEYFLLNHLYKNYQTDSTILIFIYGRVYLE